MKKEKGTTKAKRNLRVIKFFSISLVFVLIASCVAVFGCNYVENRNFRETFYCVSSLKVNNKIRIIQISDLHSCVYGKNNDALIDRMEKLQPDLIVFTGDCVDSASPNVDDVVSLCARASEIAPSYYIYGNNEVEKYYDNPLTQESLDSKYGFDDSNRDSSKLLEEMDSLEKRLEKANVKVLKNSWETITIGTTKVDIYGVLTSNPSSFWSYAGNSFNDFIYSNTNNLKVTAIHEPTIFEEYTPESWGDLMLAGHTHGGMAKIPLLGPAYTDDLGFLPEHNGHYVYGRYDVQGRPLIISSGLENNNLLRLNNQPEMVIVDVNKF